MTTVTARRPQALLSPKVHEIPSLWTLWDCYSRFTILVPATNHTADTVSDALLRHVVPYFGTPRRLLSDRGREFVGDVWGKLTSSLGIQRVLTSPYHPEGNSINERSHRTMNNMLRARLLRDLPSRKWVVEIPGIMLALNAMVHEPHDFSASMIATGREPSLPPDLDSEACASPSTEDPVAYVHMVRQRLALTHQQMTPPPAPEASNPYHEGDLIFVMTTPPERTSKLAPRWKGPFVIQRVSNAYQVTYEDDMVWRTVHVNHVKPAKTPAGSFPVPMSPPAPPSPPPMYLSRNLTWRKPAKPPQPAAPTEGSPQPAAPVAEPAQPAVSPHPVSPPPSRPTTRSSANENSAPRSELRSPAAPGRTNENSRLDPPLRRSERLKASALHINRPTQAAPAHSKTSTTMARTYPYSLSFQTCLGQREDPYSFSSLYIEELSSGRKVYIKHVQQLIDLVPRTADPSSRYALRAQVTPPGHQRIRDSLRTAIWFLLPRDGDFRWAANGLHYYLARKGRRVVLRGGNVTSALQESRLLWLHDQHPRQPSRVSETTDQVPRNNITVPRNNNIVPRNNTVPQFCDASVRAPLENLSSSTGYNSAFSSRSSDCPPVPRNNNTDRQNGQQETVSRPPKKKRNRYYRRERRARERAEREEVYKHDARSTTERSGDPPHSSIPAQVIQSGLQDSDPISAMRPAVYYPRESASDPRTNENSPFQFGPDAGESPGLRPGLYKPADPASQHTWTSSFKANSLETGPPSPPRTSEASSSSSRNRTGIVYPLQPRQRRPDVYIDVEAALPESAALQRGGPLPSHEVPTDLTRPAQRLGHKRRRKRSSALNRPAKRSPPRGRWCIL